VFPDAPPFDLDLHENQVTVLLGLLGSGKTELLEWVFGAHGVAAGDRELAGERFEPAHPADAVARGVYLLAESRHEQAIIPGWPVSAQMTLPFLKRFSSATLVRAPAERKAASRMMSDIGIVADGPSSPIQTLSGGNQQKVMIGRWLLGSPRVLLLDEPFRGVDINARHDIGTTVRTVTDSAAVLVATSDLDEALEVGDRIVVLNHGRLTADLPLAEATRERLIDAMSSRPVVPTERDPEETSPEEEASA
jgi:simple sugar transport system ATP-binding protein